MSDIIIAQPASKGALEALHALCMRHGKEMAPAEVDERKVWERILHAADDAENFWMLMAVEDDDLVGYLNLQRVGWWFSRGQFICDWGYYVVPEHRGEAGAALLREARAIAESEKLHLRICVTNPARRRGRMSREAEIVGFTPLGATLRFGEPQPTRLN